MMELDQHWPELESQQVSGLLIVKDIEKTRRLMFITSSLELLYNQQNVDTHIIFRKQKDLANNSPSLPASCSWILSISMGVVTTT